MPQRPRLLLVGPLPPPRGGITVWNERLMASDLAERWDIDVLDTNPRGPVSQEQPFYAQRVLPTARLFAALVRRGMERGTLTPPLARRPDVAHLHSNLRWSLPRAALMAEVLRAMGVPAVLHLHGGDVAERVAAFPSPVRRGVLHALRRAATVLTMTDASCAWLHAQGVGAELLPNFVDTLALAAPPGSPASRRRPRGDVGAARIVFVGAVMPAKGVFELLEALAGLPGAHLDMAGPFVDSGRGSSRALVMERVDALRLGGLVTLHGPLQAPEVRALFHAADIFALPSHREGWPLALMEAMAAGLPAVVTSAGAMPAMVRDGVSGYVVEPGDATTLRERLRDLVDHPEARASMGAAAAAWARETVDTSVVLPQLEAIWSRAGKRRV